MPKFEKEQNLISPCVHTDRIIKLCVFICDEVLSECMRNSFILESFLCSFWSKCQWSHVTAARCSFISRGEAVVSKHNISFYFQMHFLQLIFMSVSFVSSWHKKYPACSLHDSSPTSSTTLTDRPAQNIAKQHLDLRPIPYICVMLFLCGVRLYGWKNADTVSKTK